MHPTAALPTSSPSISAAAAALRDIRLLVVADAGGGSVALRRALSVFGIEVAVVPDGRRMREWLGTRECDAVLLVSPIRGDDAVAACARLRRRFPGIGVLMLSARADSLDKVVGLEAGADDYLHADCDPRELVARLRAVMRRRRAERPATGAEQNVRVGGWSFDPDGQRLSSPQTGDVRLTAGEARLLAELSSQPGRTVPRTRLQELTGGRHAGATDRSVDLLVSRLRQKLGDDPRDPRLIRTVRGCGYAFAAPCGCRRPERTSRYKAGKRATDAGGIVACGKSLPADTPRQLPMTRSVPIGGHAGQYPGLSGLASSASTTKGTSAAENPLTSLFDKIDGDGAVACPRPKPARCRPLPTMPMAPKPMSTS